MAEQEWRILIPTMDPSGYPITTQVLKTIADEVGRFIGGVTDGERHGAAAGFRAGVLAAELAHAEQRHYHAAAVARHVLDEPGQRARVERLLPTAAHPARRRLIARVGQRGPIA